MTMLSPQAEKTKKKAPEVLELQAVCGRTSDRREEEEANKIDYETVRARQRGIHIRKTERGKAGRSDCASLVPPTSSECPSRFPAVELGNQPGSGDGSLLAEQGGRAPPLHPGLLAPPQGPQRQARRRPPALQPAPRVQAAGADEDLRVHRRGRHRGRRLHRTQRTSGCDEGRSDRGGDLR